MELNDWLIVIAALAGPILAVQAQKAVETFRERRGRKLWVFQTLMATRSARLSADHVQALNMIDIGFYGSRFLFRKRSGAEQVVLDAWREYHDHLNTKFEDSELSLWNTKGDELFINLLFALSRDLGYSFDRVQLKKGAYSPVAHGNLELEQNALRRLAIRVLSGELPMKMDVTGFPVHEEALATQMALSQKLGEALDGKRALTVTVTTEREANETPERTAVIVTSRADARAAPTTPAARP